MAGKKKDIGKLRSEVQSKITKNKEWKKPRGPQKKQWKITRVSPFIDSLSYDELQAFNEIIDDDQYFKFFINSSKDEVGKKRGETLNVFKKKVLIPYKEGKPVELIDEPQPKPQPNQIDKEKDDLITEIKGQLMNTDRWDKINDQGRQRIFDNLQFIENFDTEQIKLILEHAQGDGVNDLFDKLGSGKSSKDKLSELAIELRNKKEQKTRKSAKQKAQEDVLDSTDSYKILPRGWEIFNQDEREEWYHRNEIYKKENRPNSAYGEIALKHIERPPLRELRKKQGDMNLPQLREKSGIPKEVALKDINFDVITNKIGYSQLRKTQDYFPDEINELLLKYQNDDEKLIAEARKLYEKALINEDKERENAIRNAEEKLKEEEGQKRYKNTKDAVEDILDLGDTDHIGDTVEESPLSDAQRRYREQQQQESTPASEEGIDYEDIYLKQFEKNSEPEPIPKPSRPSKPKKPSYFLSWLGNENINPDTEKSKKQLDFFNSLSEEEKMKIMAPERHRDRLELLNKMMEHKGEIGAKDEKLKSMDTALKEALDDEFNKKFRIPVLHPRYPNVLMQKPDVATMNKSNTKVRRDPLNKTQASQFFGMMNGIGDQQLATTLASNQLNKKQTGGNQSGGFIISIPLLIAGITAGATLASTAVGTAGTIIEGERNRAHQREMAKHLK